MFSRCFIFRSEGAVMQLHWPSLPFMHTNAFCIYQWYILDIVTWKEWLSSARFPSLFASMNGGECMAYLTCFTNNILVNLLVYFQHGIGKAKRIAWSWGHGMESLIFDVLPQHVKRFTSRSNSRAPTIIRAHRCASRKCIYQLDVLG